MGVKGIHDLLAASMFFRKRKRKMFARSRLAVFFLIIISDGNGDYVMFSK